MRYAFVCEINYSCVFSWIIAIPLYGEIISFSLRWMRDLRVINTTMLIPLTIQIVLKENKVSERNSDQCHNVAFLDYMYSTERKQSAGMISCFFFDAIRFCMCEQ